MIAYFTMEIGLEAGLPTYHRLYQRYIPGWRRDNFSLRYALSIPGEAIREAHRSAKKDLIEYLYHETNGGFDLDVLTIGFARRATSYKRADLLLLQYISKASDPEPPQSAS